MNRQDAKDAKETGKIKTLAGGVSPRMFYADLQKPSSTFLAVLASWRFISMALDR
jgi:hypothetical protein